MSQCCCVKLYESGMKPTTFQVIALNLTLETHVPSCALSAETTFRYAR